MSTWQFHTPDGVNDILPESCAAKRKLENNLRDLFCGRGYQEVETPGIEFYDVYAAGGGLVPQEGLFKFFDEQGRILSLRYDGTIPVARLAATVCREAEPPLRYAYVDNMYRYDEFGGGRQREFTQAGIELLGSQSPEADAEVIAIAIAAAQVCGIKDLQISLGQVEFFRGFLVEWGISGEEAELLPLLIDAKEMVALEELSDRLQLPSRGREILLRMASGYGTFDLLDEMTSLVSHPDSLAALQNLRDILTILDDYGYLHYVSIDLGMLGGLDYYTGVIFKGFTYGLGFPLFSGGRYDGLVGLFGRDLSATGFSIGVNFILTALSRQNLLYSPVEGIVYLGYDPGLRASAFSRADQLRQEGMRVICDHRNQTPAMLRRQIKAEPEARAVWLDADGRLTWLEKEV